MSETPSNPFFMEDLPTYKLVEKNEKGWKWVRAVDLLVAANQDSPENSWRRNYGFQEWTAAELWKSFACINRTDDSFSFWIATPDGNVAQNDLGENPLENNATLVPAEWARRVLKLVRMGVMEIVYQPSVGTKSGVKVDTEIPVGIRYDRRLADITSVLKAA